MILLHITLPETTCPPVQTGRRASTRGFNTCAPYTLDGGKWGIEVARDGTPLYTGVFFRKGTHMTWQFKPGNPTFPDGIKDGDVQTLTVIGEYHDDEAHCLIVKFDGYTIQP